MISDDFWFLFCFFMISDTAMVPCCSCNRKNTVCKRCACVRAGRPCSSCVPLKFHGCSNSLASCAGLAVDFGVVGTTGIPLNSDRAHMMDVSSCSESIPANDSDPSLISQQQADDLTGYDSCACNVDVPLHIDTLIHKAYGTPLIQSVGGSYGSV